MKSLRTFLPLVEPTVIVIEAILFKRTSVGDDDTNRVVYPLSLYRARYVPYVSYGTYRMYHTVRNVCIIRYIVRYFTYGIF